MATETQIVTMTMQLTPWLTGRAALLMLALVSPLYMLGRHAHEAKATDPLYMLNVDIAVKYVITPCDAC